MGAHVLQRPCCWDSCVLSIPAYCIAVKDVMYYVAPPGSLFWMRSILVYNLSIPLLCVTKCQTMSIRLELGDHV